MSIHRSSSVGAKPGLTLEVPELMKSAFFQRDPISGQFSRDLEFDASKYQLPVEYLCSCQKLRAHCRECGLGWKDKGLPGPRKSDGALWTPEEFLLLVREKLPHFKGSPRKLPFPKREPSRKDVNIDDANEFKSPDSSPPRERSTSASRAAPSVSQQVLRTEREQHLREIESLQERHERQRRELIESASAAQQRATDELKSTIRELESRELQISEKYGRDIAELQANVTRVIDANSSLKDRQERDRETIDSLETIIRSLREAQASRERSDDVDSSNVRQTTTADSRIGGKIPEAATTEYSDDFWAEFDAKLRRLAHHGRQLEERRYNFYRIAKANRETDKDEIMYAQTFREFDQFRKENIRLQRELRPSNEVISKYLRRKHRWLALKKELLGTIDDDSRVDDDFYELAFNECVIIAEQEEEEREKARGPRPSTPTRATKDGDGKKSWEPTLDGSSQGRQPGDRRQSRSRERGRSLSRSPGPARRHAQPRRVFRPSRSRSETPPSRRNSRDRQTRSPGRRSDGGGGAGWGSDTHSHRWGTPQSSNHTSGFDTNRPAPPKYPTPPPQQDSHRPTNTKNEKPPGNGGDSRGEIPKSDSGRRGDSSFRSDDERGGARQRDGGDHSRSDDYGKRGDSHSRGGDDGRRDDGHSRSGDDGRRDDGYSRRDNDRRSGDDPSRKSDGAGRRDDDDDRRSDNHSRSGDSYPGTWRSDYSDRPPEFWLKQQARAMHYMARQHSQKKSFERDRWEEKSCNLDLSKGVLDDAPIYKMTKITPGFRYKNIFEYDKFEKSAEKFLLRALVRQNLGEHMWDLIKSTARAAHAEYSKILAENPDDVDRLVCVETDLSAYDRQEKEVSRRVWSFMQDKIPDCVLHKVTEIADMNHRTEPRFEDVLFVLRTWCTPTTPADVHICREKFAKERLVWEDKSGNKLKLNQVLMRWKESIRMMERHGIYDPEEDCYEPLDRIFTTQMRNLGDIGAGTMFSFKLMSYEDDRKVPTTTNAEVLFKHIREVMNIFNRADIKNTQMGPQYLKSFQRDSEKATRGSGKDDSSKRRNSSQSSRWTGRSGSSSRSQSRDRDRRDRDRNRERRDDRSRDRRDDRGRDRDRDRRDRDRDRERRDDRGRDRDRRDRDRDRERRGRDSSRKRDENGHLIGGERAWTPGRGRSSDRQGGRAYHVSEENGDEQQRAEETNNDDDEVIPEHTEDSNDDDCWYDEDEDYEVFDTNFFVFHRKTCADVIKNPKYECWKVTHPDEIRNKHLGELCFAYREYKKCVHPDCKCGKDVKCEHRGKHLKCTVPKCPVPIGHDEWACREKHDELQIRHVHAIRRSKRQPRQRPPKGKGKGSGSKQLF